MHRPGSILSVLTVLALAACVGDGASTSTSSPTGSTSTPIAGPSSTSLPSTTSPGLEGLGFDEFVEESYRVLLSRDPQFLTSLGVSEQFGGRDDQLNDMSPAYLTETQQIEANTLEQLHTHDRPGLDGEDQLTYDVYEWYLDTVIAGHEFAYHHWPVHHYVNSYNVNLLIFLQEEHVISDVDDAEDYVSRVGQIGRQVDQVVESLQTSVDAGIVPPSLVVDRTVQSLRDDLGGVPEAEAVDVENLPLFTTFTERLDAASIGSAESEDLSGRLATALEESFVPGWITLHDYIDSLRAISTEEPGAGRLPDGDDFYAWLLRWHTSTGLTADEVHQMGLENVARLQDEMRSAFADLGYASDQPIPALVDRATQEAGFLSGEDNIVATNEGLIVEAEQMMRPHFGLWPQAPVEVVADQGGGGFYVPGSADGTRAGKFHAGTSGPAPLITTPTINFHEAVPGHHTQIAIAQELGLPTFRRFVRYNAYAEGWGLYAERLAAELGAYEDDPLGDIGRLQLELLRAVRLVVDTGIHALGWSVQEAQSYMQEVIPTWTHEVERYIVLPGQATGYMIGMQQILRLREEFEASEGDGFELAEFHDAMLGSGSLPLTILDDVLIRRAQSD